MDRERHSIREPFRHARWRAARAVRMMPATGNQVAQSKRGLAELPNYKWYVVGMLWTIAFLNYADRQAIFSLFPLLEKEMGLNSVQLGLLGSSFAWVYGVCAPFAGNFVDRIRRKS